MLFVGNSHGNLARDARATRALFTGGSLSVREARVTRFPFTTIDDLPTGKAAMMRERECVKEKMMALARSQNKLIHLQVM